MPKIHDDIEISLTRAELRQALRCWMQSKTLIHDYNLGDVSVHGSGKYVVRFTVTPPIEKSDKKTLTLSELAET